MKCFYITCVMLLLINGSCKNKQHSENSNLAKKFYITNCYVNNHLESDSENVYVSFVFCIKNKSTVPVKIPNYIFTLTSKDIIIEKTLMKHTEGSREVAMESNQGAIIEAGSTIEINVWLDGFSSFIHYPEGTYKIYIKKIPNCYAVIQKKKSGLIINNYEN